MGSFFTCDKQVMFLSVFDCLFVSRITQKLLDQFSHNLVERWDMVQRNTR